MDEWSTKLYIVEARFYTLYEMYTRFVNLWVGHLKPIQ